MSMRLLCCLLLAWPVWSHAAAALGMATIVDGGATLVRGSTKLPIAEGLRLAAGDIVGTDTARHLRLEFADGVLLDLGPATRVQLHPRLGGDARRRAARIYLLQGWVKLTAPTASGAAPGPLLTSAALDVQAAGRGTVIAIEGAEIAVFAESGAATLAERRPGGGVVALKEGMFYSRSGAAAGEVVATPRSAFIRRVPKAFLDTLPPRAAQFGTREPASAPAAPLVYPDVQPWIDAEPALRGGFVTRWRALARQGEFRKALEQDLAAHPEWDRVLHPERYLPRPAASPAPRLPSSSNDTTHDRYR